MRLIDADALLRDMETLWDWPTVNGIQTDTALRQVMADIRNAPTVQEGQNQPRVTRCEECRHWDRESGLTVRKCDFQNRLTRHDWYCSGAAQ